jgi:transposase
MNEAQVPLSNISRRLKLSRRTLEKLRKAGEPDVRVLTKTPSHGGRFSRFHDRAVALLREMLDEAKHPLTLREMQAELARQCGLRVSRPWLSRFMRERLDATFRLVKPIS